MTQNPQTSQKMFVRTTALKRLIFTLKESVTKINFCHKKKIIVTGRKYLSKNKIPVTEQDIPLAGMIFLSP